MSLRQMMQSSCSHFCRAKTLGTGGTNTCRHLATVVSDNMAGCPVGGGGSNNRDDKQTARRIIRFIDKSGNEQLALQPQENGPASLLSGDLFRPETLVDTGSTVKWPLSKGYVLSVSYVCIRKSYAYLRQLIAAP